MSEERILQRVSQALKGLPGNFEKKGDDLCLRALMAERKSFLSKQALWYNARFRVDQQSMTVTFTEMLEERKSGLGAGGMDDISPGFSFKKSVTKSSSEGLEGVIDEQSSLFSKSYSYSFDHKLVRNAVREAAEAEGYLFKYSLWGKI